MGVLGDKVLAQSDELNTFGLEFLAPSEEIDAPSEKIHALSEENEALSEIAETRRQKLGENSLEHGGP